MRRFSKVEKNVNAAIQFIDTKENMKINRGTPSPSIPYKQTLSEKKMIEAFGIPLLNSEGKPLETFRESIWLRVVKLRGKLYRLSGVQLGKKLQQL